MADNPWDKLEKVNVDSSNPWSKLEKINVSSSPKEKSIGEDVLQGFKDVPSALLNTVKSLPVEAWGAYSQAVNDPIRAIRNAEAGIIESGRGIANLPSNAAQYLGKKGIISPESANYLPRSPLDKVNVPEYVGNKGQQSGDEFIRALSGYAPFGVAAEAGALSGAARAGTRAGAAGTYGASQEQNPITAAALGPAMSGVSRTAGSAADALMKASNKIRPSSMLSGNLTNEELQRNLEATKGTNTPLGDVIGSPTLKKTYENVISEVPFSGTDKIAKNISNQVGEKASKILSDAAEKDKINIDSDPDYMVKSLLNAAKKEQESKKNELYIKANELAEKEGFVPDLNEFTKLAREKGSSISASPIAQSIPGFDKLLKNTGNYSEAESKPPTLQEAKNLKSSLYQKGQDLMNSGVGSERSLGREYMDLYKALSNDINKSIEEKGSSEFKEAHGNAENNYKLNFSKLLDKDLKKQLGRGNEQDYEAIVRSIVNPSKVTDKSSKIEKIQALLPNDKKNTLGYAYLKGSTDREGNLDVNKISTMINQLGTRQFKALFPDQKVQDQLNNFIKLKKMNNESLSSMENPKTGYRNAKTIIGSIQALSGVAGGLPGLGASALASLTSNLAAKYMTSPKVRENMVKAIQEQQIKGIANKDMPQLYLNKYAGIDKGIRNAAVPYSVNEQGER